MSPADISIWTDPDVRRIYDMRDGQPWPRFSTFNDTPELPLVQAFLEADQDAGSAGPADAYVQACLAGVRLVEALQGRAEAGWIKFFLFQTDQNAMFLWDLHRRSIEVAAVAEWTVATLEANGWGADGNASAVGQMHSGAMALAAQAGGGLRHDPATGQFVYGDGSDARALAGVSRHPTGTAPLPPAPASDEVAGTPSPDEVMRRRLDEAQEGDLRSTLVIRAVAASAGGDEVLAEDLFQQAARQGDVDSMVELGAMHARRGDVETARFWLESAAATGHTGSFALLARLAEQSGNEPAERTWSKKAADAGDSWAMGNHAYFLLNDAVNAQKSGASEASVAKTLEDCRGYATRAAQDGQVNAMYSAGVANAFLGDRAESRRLLEMAEANGHTNARPMMERFGLV